MRRLEQHRTTTRLHHRRPRTAARLGTHLNRPRRSSRQRPHPVVQKVRLDGGTLRILRLQNELRWAIGVIVEDQDAIGTGADDEPLLAVGDVDPTLVDRGQADGVVADPAASAAVADLSELVLEGLVSGEVEVGGGVEEEDEGRAVILESPRAGRSDGSRGNGRGRRRGGGGNRVRRSSRWA